MPKGEYSKTKESIVPLRGIVRNGTLVSVLDHEGKEIGGLVTSSTDVTGGISVLWSGSQAEYDAIAVKDNSTLYVIV